MAGGMEGGASKLSHKAFLSIERRNIENEHIFSSMGQKVNPLCFRLGVTQRHRSHWFAKKLKYSYLLRRRRPRARARRARRRRAQV